MRVKTANQSIGAMRVPRPVLRTRLTIPPLITPGFLPFPTAFATRPLSVMATNVCAQQGCVSMPQLPPVTNAQWEPSKLITRSLPARRVLPEPTPLPPRPRVMIVLLERILWVTPPAVQLATPVPTPKRVKDRVYVSRALPVRVPTVLYPVSIALLERILWATPVTAQLATLAQISNRQLVNHFAQPVRSADLATRSLYRATPPPIHNAPPVLQVKAGTVPLVQLAPMVSTRPRKVRVTVQQLVLERNQILIELGLRIVPPTPTVLGLLMNVRIVMEVTVKLDKRFASQLHLVITGMKYMM